MVIAENSILWFKHKCNGVNAPTLISWNGISLTRKDMAKMRATARTSSASSPSLICRPRSGWQCVQRRARPGGSDPSAPTPTTKARRSPRARCSAPRAKGHARCDRPDQSGLAFGERDRRASCALSDRQRRGRFWRMRSARRGRPHAPWRPGVQASPSCAGNLRALPPDPDRHLPQ